MVSNFLPYTLKWSVKGLHQASISSSVFYIWYREAWVVYFLLLLEGKCARAPCICNLLIQSTYQVRKQAKKTFETEDTWIIRLPAAALVDVIDAEGKAEF